MNVIRVKSTKKLIPGILTIGLMSGFKIPSRKLNVTSMTHNVDARGINITSPVRK
jgi:hypothetical protein